jgi:hypothetical protein
MRLFAKACRMAWEDRSANEKTYWKINTAITAGMIAGLLLPNVFLH